VNVELLKDLHLESGLALNTTKYSLEDVFKKMGSIGTSLYFEIFGHPDSNVVSAKSGKNAFTSVSKGFQRLWWKKRSLEGQINTDLKPSWA
jgi:iron complex outermembrane receptor protein